MSLLRKKAIGEERMNKNHATSESNNQSMNDYESVIDWLIDRWIDVDWLMDGLIKQNE